MTRHRRYHRPNHDARLDVEVVTRHRRYHRSNHDACYGLATPVTMPVLAFVRALSATPAFCPAPYCPRTCYSPAHAGAALPLVTGVVLQNNDRLFVRAPRLELLFRLYRVVPVVIVVHYTCRFVVVAAALLASPLVPGAFATAVLATFFFFK